MADDIVERHYCSYADPPCEACTFCAARAEIERLRAEKNDLLDFIDSMPSGDAAFAAWEEARRG